MNNLQLTHDFLKWLMENYAVRLEINEKDADLFERRYPDLAAYLEKENESDERKI